MKAVTNIFNRGLRPLRPWRLCGRYSGTANLQRGHHVLEVKGWRMTKIHPTVRDMKKDTRMTPDTDALAAEERRIRRLRRAMDVAAALLWRVNLTLEEAQDVVGHAKNAALQLFPDKEETFDLIYGSRFRRILVEKYRLQ